MIRISPTANSIPFSAEDSRLTTFNVNDAVLEVNNLLVTEESARADADVEVLAAAQAYVLEQLAGVVGSLFIDGGPAPETYFDSNYVIDGGSAT